MTDSASEEIPINASTADKPKSAKKAAKKTAKKAAKKVAKKAAKKTSAKKAAKKTAKKAAKKAAKKVTADVVESTIQQEELPLSSSDKAPKVTEDNQKEEKQRIGRVKGGGRVDRNKGEKENASSEGSSSENTNEPNSNDSPNENGGQNEGRGKFNRNRRNRRNRRERDPDFKPRPVVLEGPPVEVNGMLELAPKGFGFLRTPDKDFEQDNKDVFVTPDFVRKYGLRQGVWIKGIAMKGAKGPQLSELHSINEEDPDLVKKYPHFEELKAVNPTRRIAFETTSDRATTRILDLVSPIGRGQRGLIVSPPRSGKTTLMLHTAQALQENYDEQIHLIILLVDERPEEVTEFKRSLPEAEIYASSNDQGARNHCRMAELCIERAKRLVEAGQDVFILMDSITRLARAYNSAGGGGGGKGRHNKKKGNRGYQSGGIVAGALEMPRRIFAAARDTRTAGSLTILATALVQTNSKADELIFQEFKGTGNMELVLDRRVAEQYLYPAVDIFKSGTRREELLFAPHQLHKIHLIRRGLSGHKPSEAIERLLYFIRKFPNNNQMLLEIKG